MAMNCCQNYPLNNSSGAACTLKITLPVTRWQRHDCNNAARLQLLLQKNLKSKSDTAYSNTTNEKKILNQ